MEAVKHDDGKLPYHLLPFDAVDEVVAVLRHGAKLYGDRNWEEGMDWSRLLGASLRHLSSYSQGQRIDPETNLYALAHAICNLLFLLAYEKRMIGKDDLGIKSPMIFDTNRINRQWPPIRPEPSFTGFV